MEKRTPLIAEHLALGAKTTAFAGWEMPVAYPQGPIAEHRRVREAAGLFDLSHMGQALISGPDALAFMQHIATANIARIKLGEAGYAPMCYADGGLVDDTFVYHIPDGYYVVLNASNTVKDLRWLDYQSSGYDVHIEDRSSETCMLAIQGPRAEQVLQPLTTVTLGEMARNRVQSGEVAGTMGFVARTGYTGEDGFELYLPVADAVPVWRTILAAGEPLGLWPIGLAARDSLRFEPCFPLYGHELDATHTPLQAGLGWAVALKKGPFVGRDALLKERLEGLPLTLVGFEMADRGVPRHGMTVSVDGQPVGHVTSGLYAPTLDSFLGMAYLPPHQANIGQEIGIELRGQTRMARIIERPFYAPSYQKTRKGS